MDRVWSKLYVDCREISLGAHPDFTGGLKTYMGFMPGPLWDDRGGFLRSPHSHSIISKKGIFPGRDCRPHESCLKGLGPIFLEGALSLQSVPGSQSQ